MPATGVDGFVLVGGRSSRMGRDKALLPWKGTTLAQYVAGVVGESTGGLITLVGDPGLYGGLGYAVRPDRVSGHGPIGGVLTALQFLRGDWALIAGCDMPGITVEALRVILAEIGREGVNCVVAMGPTGPEPLCAIYHRACRDTIERSVAAGRFRMRDTVAELRTFVVTGIDPACFANLNTPRDLEAFAQ